MAISLCDFRYWDLLAVVFFPTQKTHSHINKNTNLLLLSPMYTRLPEWCNVKGFWLLRRKKNQETIFDYIYFGFWFNGSILYMWTGFDVILLRKKYPFTFFPVGWHPFISAGSIFIPAFLSFFFQFWFLKLNRRHQDKPIRRRYISLQSFWHPRHTAAVSPFQNINFVLCILIM